jgi:RNA polymerase sigma-70 factor (ECF subfamily)
MSIARQILGDADLAQDAVQATLIAAWRDLAGLREPALFEVWVQRILVRICYTTARQRRRLVNRVRILPIERPSGRDETLTVDDRDQLERAFGRLTLEQRTVLVFHHYLDLPIAEIASRLAIPEGTVKSRLHHATTALRASLEADARTPSLTQERPA